MFGLVFIYQIDNRRRFSSARRPIKQQIREMRFIDNVPEKHAVERVQHYIVEMVWPVFFYPRHRFRLFGGIRRAK
jgi:hypothetical protein